MASSVEIAGVKYARGQKAAGRLNLGKRAAGDDLVIPMNLVIGETEGPRLVLVFCQHGNEWIPLEGWYELFRDLDPSKFAGEIVALPAANPIAFEFKSRNSWMDALHGAHGNLNRAWPGREDGWLTERMSHKIDTEILSGSDCVIDFHDGNPGRLHIYYSYLSLGLEGEYGALMERLGKGFGMEILISESLPIKGTLSEYLTSRAIPNIGVEVGHFYGFDDGRHRLPAEVTRTGIENVMKILGMTDGTLVLPPRQAVVKPETRVKATNGGLLRSRVSQKDIGRVFPKGAPLFDIIDISIQEVIETVSGPYNKNFLLTAPGHTVPVGIGDHGCHVADADTLQWIENAG